MVDVRNRIPGRRGMGNGTLNQREIVAEGGMEAGMEREMLAELKCGMESGVETRMI